MLNPFVTKALSWFNTRPQGTETGCVKSDTEGVLSMTHPGYKGIWVGLWETEAGSEFPRIVKRLKISEAEGAVEGVRKSGREYIAYASAKSTFCVELRRIPHTNRKISFDVTLGDVKITPLPISAAGCSTRLDGIPQSQSTVRQFTLESSQPACLTIDLYSEPLKGANRPPVEVPFTFKKIQIDIHESGPLAKLPPGLVVYTHTSHDPICAGFTKWLEGFKARHTMGRPGLLIVHTMHDVPGRKGLPCCLKNDIRRLVKGIFGEVGYASLDARDRKGVEWAVLPLCSRWPVEDRLDVWVQGEPLSGKTEFAKSLSRCRSGSTTALNVPCKDKGMHHYVAPHICGYGAGQCLQQVLPFASPARPCGTCISLKIFFLPRYRLRPVYHSVLFKQADDAVYAQSTRVPRSLSQYESRFAVHSFREKYSVPEDVAEVVGAYLDLE
eukprot:TRINITY_DN15876_c0_g2_i1.p1 TRINITY_DN15876_c0_g2~~TRINITY_DN15876_c0_g2_i1.p1  ORF type:complete len:440 (+),score=44.46 TRINITY_DN15876_c0_g2_i1:104-1423(+)